MMKPTQEEIILRYLERNVELFSPFETETHFGFFYVKKIQHVFKVGIESYGNDINRAFVNNSSPVKRILEFDTVIELKEFIDENISFSELRRVKSFFFFP